MVYAREERDMDRHYLSSARYLVRTPHYPVESSNDLAEDVRVSYTYPR